MLLSLIHILKRCRRHEEQLKERGDDKCDSNNKNDHSCNHQGTKDRNDRYQQAEYHRYCRDAERNDNRKGEDAQKNN